MSEHAEKGQLEVMIGDILGPRYIRSLVLIIVSFFLPIIFFKEVFGNVSVRSLMWLGSGTIVLSTILIYANFRMNPSEEAAECLWGDIFVYCYGLGGLSLILAVSVYFSALISFTVFYCILIGAMIAGSIKVHGKFGLALFAVLLLIMAAGLYH